jgi:Family of unknown function (DUF6171)
MEPKEFPTFFDQIKNLSNLAKDVVVDMATGQDVFVSDEIRTQRLEICSQCDYLDGGRCRACGCFVETKTKVSSAHCPVMKWTAIKG